MEQKVIDLLERVFGDTEITAESSQDTVSEWDSMHQLSIAFEIESEFGISLDPDELACLKSVKDIVRLIANKR